jgi:hypothetical protein
MSPYEREELNCADPSQLDKAIAEALRVIDIILGDMCPVEAATC